MGKRKGVNRKRQVAEIDEDDIDYRQGASIAAPMTHKDLHDSEDEFHREQDRIALQGWEEEQSQEDDDDNEIMALDGIDSEDYIDDDDDEDLARLEALAKRLKPLKEEDEKSSASESDEMDDTAWGKRKNIYYNAEEDASDDEEVALEEEKEAIRLQKKRAATLAEDDYYDDVPQETEKKRKRDDEDADLLDSDLASSDSEEEQDVSEFTKNLSSEELMSILSTSKPELLEFIKDFKEKFEELSVLIAPTVERYAEMDLSTLAEQEQRVVAYFQLKHRLLLTYLTNLSFYFSLHAHNVNQPSHAKVSTRTHPVLDTLVEIQEMLERLEENVEGSEEGQTEGMGVFMQWVDFVIENGAGKAVSYEMDDGESEEDDDEVDQNDEEDEEDMEDEDTLEVEETQKDSKSAHIPEFTVMPLPKSIKSSTKRKLKPSTEFGEDAELDDVDMEDKLDRKKSLKFHVTRVDQSTESRNAKLKKASGDLDVPIKIKEPKVDKSSLDYDSMEDEEDGFGELGASGDESQDSETNEALAYYNAIKNAKLSAKRQREEDIQEAKEWSSRAALEAYQSQDKADGKRAATWKILKNKGLTPKRKKEDRNPRVKRRNKYEKAVKKLKDFRRVAVDKRTVGAYAGESTGIKSRLARSVKL